MDQLKGQICDLSARQVNQSVQCNPSGVRVCTGCWESRKQGF